VFLTSCHTIYLQVQEIPESDGEGPTTFHNVFGGGESSFFSNCYNEWWLKAEKCVSYGSWNRDLHSRFETAGLIAT
jgi:hypothetical protein